MKIIEISTEEYLKCTSLFQLGITWTRIGYLNTTELHSDLTRFFILLSGTDKKYTGIFRCKCYPYNYYMVLFDEIDIPDVIKNYHVIK